LVPGFGKLNKKYLKKFDRPHKQILYCKDVKQTESKMNNPLYDNLFGVHAENDDPFLYLIDGKTITYRQFLAASGRIANTLVGKGLEPGDCVAIQVEKSPEMLNIYAACAQAGLVFLPLNPSYTVDELKYFIENSEARLIICDEKNKDDLTTIAQKFDILIETLNQDSTGSIIEKAKSSPEDLKR
jgi:Acyl-CoA synthetases (AMP-forming)/AMP-acid ligases II